MDWMEFEKMCSEAPNWNVPGQRRFRCIDPETSTVWVEYRDYDDAFIEDDVASLKKQHLNVVYRIRDENGKPYKNDPDPLGLL